jgi:hypothetical protein
MLEQDANYHLNISSLLPCVNYVLLKPRHVSVVQDHIQEVFHIKGKLQNLKGKKIQLSL